MRILCLFIPHLPIQWEMKSHPDLAQTTLIIGGFPHERKLVLDCSEKAIAQGVSPGMILRQASHRCPDAVFSPVDEAGYAKAFDEVLDVLDQFSPAVEADNQGRAFLDITGTEQLFGPLEELAARIRGEVFQRVGFHSQAGISSSKFLAGIAASLAFTSPLVVEGNEEKEFLKPLPIELLPLTREAVDWLKRLGLRTMGQVAALPVNALSSQLGQDGTMAYRLANGIDERQVVSRPKPDVLEQALSLEQPLESLDALLAALGVLLDKLIPLLRGRCQVCYRIKLRFRFDNTELWQSLILKTPSDSKPDILGVLKRHLEAASFPEGISEIHLILAGLGGESGKQASLSTGTKGIQAESLQRLDSDLRARFGHSPLKRVVLIDPDCRIPERRAVLADSSSINEQDRSAWSYP